MKRIVASVGLIAVGASGLQAALLPALTAESGKPWNLSTTLRGFYDDNINSTGSNKEGSSGFEVSPSLQFSLPWEQTTLSFGYVYSFKYYDKMPSGNTEHYDQTHDFHAALTHAFSERYSMSVKDSFVIGQEPDMLRAGNTYNSYQRISGSNLRNYGSINFSAQMTPEFGVDVGYANTMYSYADNQFSVNFNAPPVVQASTSGLSDYLDHLVHIDGHYQLLPQTIGVVGFQFRETDYTGNQVIGYDVPRNQFLWSSVRNARSYYGYVGLDHNFRPDLTGSFRVGGRYTDYYNDPTSQNTGSPYAMTSLQYIYLPGSSIQIGSSYDYSATSQFSIDNTGGVTLNAQSATIFGSVNHKITPKLYGNLIAQYQNSTYYGGTYDNKTDNYYTLGVNLQYHFTPNFSGEVGYSYDKLDSEVSDSFSRNRVYVGVTGSY